MGLLDDVNVNMDVYLHKDHELDLDSLDLTIVVRTIVVDNKP